MKLFKDLYQIARHSPCGAVLVLFALPLILIGALIYMAAAGVLMGWFWMQNTLEVTLDERDRRAAQ